MNVMDSVLSGIDGGRVLDVATYEGNFVQILMSNLKSFAGIVGIDIHVRAIETARLEFVDYGSSLGLRNLACVDDRDKDSDPREPTRIEQLDGLIDSTLQRAENTNNFAALRERGEQLRQRLHQVGAQREPILMMLGEK